jgi:ABC-type sugar transport system permease subunit
VSAAAVSPSMLEAPRWQPRWTPWLFLSPFLLVFAVFTAWPLVRSLVLSTEQTWGPGASRSVGLSNYAWLLSDPLFYKALRNTILYTLGSLFIQLPLALGLAMLLETPGVRGRAVARLVLFSPSLVGVVFAAMMFGLILEARSGLLNRSLAWGTAWLPEAYRWNIDFPWITGYTIAALVVASLWMYVGFNMVYFSAALQNVRADLREAATLDGAGWLARFRHVVWPAIRPVASFVILLSVVGSLQVFELPYLILDVAGRPSDSGLTLIMYLYRNGFESGDLGYASAIGWVLGVVLIACSAAERLLARGETEGGA